MKIHRIKKRLLYTGGLSLLLGTNLFCPNVVSADGGSIEGITDANWAQFMADEGEKHVQSVMKQIYGGYDTDVSNWTVTIGSSTASFTKLGYYIYGGDVKAGNRDSSYNTVIINSNFAHPKQACNNA